MSSGNDLPEEPSFFVLNGNILQRQPLVTARLPSPGQRTAGDSTAPEEDSTERKADIISPVSTQKETLVEALEVSPASAFYGDLSLAPVSAPSQSPLLWCQDWPAGDDIPILPAPRWQGSRELEELMRARQAEQLAQQQQQHTSRGTQMAQKHHLPSVTTGSHPGQTGQRRGVEGGGRSSSAGARKPFMHYDDYTYFDPGKETDDGGVRAATIFSNRDGDAATA